MLIPGNKNDYLFELEQWHRWTHAKEFPMHVHWLRCEFDWY